MASRHPYWFSLNVWVNTLGDQHLELLVLPNRLTNAVYCTFLVNDLPVLLEHVPLDQWQHMWFIHDGAPTHVLCIVRQHLNQTFGEQWIGRGDPVNWPAQSPDLSPLVFWLWGHLKSLVYSAPITDLEILQQQVEKVSQEIRMKPGMTDRVHMFVRWRAESCVEMYGNHIEHLLWRSHEHCPYLSRHWLTENFCSFTWVLYHLKTCNHFLTPYVPVVKLMTHPIGPLYSRRAESNFVVTQLTLTCHRCHLNWCLCSQFFSYL